MKKASKNLLEGVITFAVGVALRLFTEGVETPVITLTKVGVVLMVAGGVFIVLGLFQSMRGANAVERS
ncbi:DUF5708 family protein [Streptomyces sp. McG3]|uniref:DUF5708 family protein n=1 Tax=Streptomyces sp. McG3 TaxID=2725483 RepID=UPI001BE94246|nr:DUF5708 family protein [Streptomyces sp. McG3]MBT2897241.1 hypothetical protein [Streptomyces sp. McG3]